MVTLTNVGSLRISNRLGFHDASSHCLGRFSTMAHLIPPPAESKGLRSRVLKGVRSMATLPEVPGFGSQKTKSKAKHKIVTLDPAKVEQVLTFDLFARRFSENGLALTWESIGEILLERQVDLEMALKERRKKLLAAAMHQYPSLLVLSAGEEVQYGYRKSGEEWKDKEIVAVDVKGKELNLSIPAILRAEDGVKPSPRQFQRK